VSTLPSGATTARHLVVVLSAHGYGHLAQTAPVLNALRELLPQLRLTVRSALSQDRVSSRLYGAYDYRPEATDFGMIMQSALAVDLESSAQAYAQLHHRWQRRVDAEARLLESLAPDLVLSNVAYLPLAGAALAGIPAVALCCLNWADIYQHYFARRPEATGIYRQMVDAYAQAHCFLKPAPSMPMPTITRGEALSPIAARGQIQRARLRRDLPEDERLIMVAMGGIALRLPMESWPVLPGVHWVVQRDWEVRRDDVLVLESFGLPFTDVLAGCDALITKPGYGSVAEAVCNGAPVLYVRRGDWPEEPYLIEWLQAHGRALEVALGDLQTGRLAEPLEALWRQSPAPPVEPAGTRQAAERLRDWLAYSTSDLLTWCQAHLRHSWL
jgi:hypothetical protein